MSLGTLYGVGVGPGAPDLITLRAVEVLRRADVLAIPRSSPFSASMAWRIAKPSVGEVPDQERLFFTFPMSFEPERLKPAWEEAFEAIGTRLLAGKTVAFLTEGDPMLFSTFVYLLGAASSRWPDLPIEIVPAVSSIMAVAAATGTPLADGQERIAIVPATYGVEDLEDILERFDTTVLMKLGGEIPRIREALARTGLTDRAVYVERASMPEQRIVRDLSAVEGVRGDCFAMAIVAKKTRSGVLAGASPRDGGPRARRSSEGGT